MPYELRIAGQAQSRIREYKEQYGNHAAAPIIDGIEAGLEAIATQPELGQVISEAFRRPVHRFSFEGQDDEGDHVRYYVQAAYSVDEETKAVTILDFGPIPF